MYRLPVNADEFMEPKDDLLKLQDIILKNLFTQQILVHVMPRHVCLQDKNGSLKQLITKIAATSCLYAHT